MRTFTRTILCIPVHPHVPPWHPSFLLQMDALCIFGLSLCLRAQSREVGAAWDSSSVARRKGDSSIRRVAQWFSLHTPFWLSLSCLPDACLRLTQILQCYEMHIQCNSSFCVPVSYLIAGSGSYRASDLCWFGLSFVC